MTDNIFDMSNIKPADNIDIEIAKCLGRNITTISEDGILEAYQYNNNVYIANYTPPKPAISKVYDN